MSDWIPTSLARDIEVNYLQPMAHLLNRSLVVTSVKNASLFSDTATGLLNSDFDGAVTSTSFHSWLHAEHVCMGPLPFGLSKEEKAHWLLSSQGQELQNQFFGFLGLSPQVVGIGTDLFGAFSKSKIDSVQSLRGHSRSRNSIAFSDARAAWFIRQGLSVQKIAPFEQAAELNRGTLHISEPLSPSGALGLIESHLRRDENWTYNLFPKIRTAPTVFCLWRKTKWDQHSFGLEPERRALGRAGFERVSREWTTREEKALSDIASRNSVHEIPSQVVDLFKGEAQLLHQLLAQRSPFAHSLVQVHATAAT